MFCDFFYTPTKMAPAAKRVNSTILWDRYLNDFWAGNTNIIITNTMERAIYLLDNSHQPLNNRACSKDLGIPFTWRLIVGNKGHLWHIIFCGQQRSRFLHY